MLPIPGYEGLYSVTPEGKVWRHEKLTKRRHAAGWVAICRDASGYLFVTLFKDKVKKLYKVHRLVAQVYLGYDPNGPLWVLHKNDVRDDPRVCNLFIGTPKDNQQDCIRKGRKVVCYGEKNPNAKLSDDDCRKIRNESGTHSEIAKRYGVSQTQVSRIKAFVQRKLSSPGEA